MQKTPELFLTLLFFTFLLLIILGSIIAIFRFVRKKEKKASHIEMGALTDAFKTLGSEINILKEQLVLKDQLATVGEISAGIAHQLKNPMAVIAGYAKLLLKSMDNSDERREMLMAILKEIDEMNRVMDELFKLSRHEQINKSEIDIAFVIKKLIDGTADFREKVSLGEYQPFIVKADEILISQVIKNLIQNAIDASGEVKIELKKGIFSGKEGAIINVSDKGMGISKDDRNKIFKPFYTTKPHGIGIGLTITNKIITAHGGNIWVDSIHGEGTTFSIFLPD